MTLYSETLASKLIMNSISHWPYNQHNLKLSKTMICVGASCYLILHLTLRQPVKYRTSFLSYPIPPSKTKQQHKAQSFAGHASTQILDGKLDVKPILRQILESGHGDPEHCCLLLTEEPFHNLFFVSVWCAQRFAS